VKIKSAIEYLDGMTREEVLVTPEIPQDELRQLREEGRFTERISDIEQDFGKYNQLWRVHESYYLAEVVEEE